MNLREAQDLLIRLGTTIDAVSNTRAERSAVRFHGNLGSVAVHIEHANDVVTSFEFVGHNVRATGIDEAAFAQKISDQLDRVEITKVRIAEERVVDVQAQYDERRP